MALILITGALGSGKTFLATVLAYLRYFKNGIPIYANYQITFADRVSPLEVLLMRKLENCVIVGDEGWTVIDSRASTTGENEFLNKVILTSRKRGVDIILTAQMAHMVDKRYRGIADYMFVCENKGKKRGRDGYIKAWMLTWEDNLWDRPAKPMTFRIGQYCDLYDTKEEIENDKELWLSEMAKICLDKKEYPTLMPRLEAAENLTARRNILGFLVGARRTYADMLLQELGF